MRGRLGTITREYELFRNHFHKNRILAENGKSALKNLLGPQTPLGVDPNKDIFITGIVIGGRTTDDSHESRLRHDFELQNPHIHIYSWDSWLRRIKRWP